MKKIIILCVILSYTSVLFPQYFSKLGEGIDGEALGFYGDSIENKVFAAGNVRTLGLNGIVVGSAYWVNNNWIFLEQNPSASPSPAFVRFKNKLYLLGGGFKTSDTAAAYEFLIWNNDMWMPSGNTYIEKTVYDAINVGDSIMYISGFFDSYGGVPTWKVVKYDGEKYYGFPKLPNALPEGDNVARLAFYKNELYIGGYFGGLSGGHIAKWNGAAWEKVGNSFSGYRSGVGDMVSYQGNLIVGGTFCRDEGNPGNSVAAWNGSSWISMDANIACPSLVSDMEIFQGELYAAGIIGLVGDTIFKSVVKWNGAAWETFATIDDGQMAAMTTLRGELYFSGTFNAINGVPAYHVAKYSPTGGIKPIGAGAIFPNPTQGTFTLNDTDANLATIAIYNVLGQRVNNFSITQAGKNVSIEIPQTQAEGIYCVVIESANGRYSEKFVLKY